MVVSPNFPGGAQISRYLERWEFAGSHPSVVYNEPLGLYLMANWGMGTAADGEWFAKPSYLGFWSAPQPWGPWTQVHEDTSWTPGGDAGVLRSLKPEQFADAQFGAPTVTDILKELEKPGRDPRPEFKTASFKDGVEEMKDLTPGMLLEGVVTNVANFGAFVDIGVHQDGLVHVSALADRFVKDPREVVKPGDIVKVKVLEVDLKRKRISLTMRLRDEAGARPPVKSGAPGDRPLSQRDRQHMTDKPKAGGTKAPDNAFAAAFSKAGFTVRK